MPSWEQAYYASYSPFYSEMYRPQHVQFPHPTSSPIASRPAFDYPQSTSQYQTSYPHNRSQPSRRSRRSQDTGQAQRSQHQQSQRSQSTSGHDQRHTQTSAAGATHRQDPDDPDPSDPDGDPSGTDSGSSSSSEDEAGDNPNLTAEQRLKILEKQIKQLKKKKSTQPPDWARTLLPDRKPRYKMQPLQLAEFKGDHTAWPEWWDMFYALVHKEPTYTDIEKLAYLYNYLPESSDARNSLAGFKKVGGSYEAVVNRLKTKYGQKSRLLATLIKNILYAKAADSPANAQKLVDKFWGDTRALKSYGVPLDDPYTSIMLITVLQSKMPIKVSEQWTLQLSQDATQKANESQLDVTIPPEEACPPMTLKYTVDQFLTFCEERIRVINTTKELAESG
jgi:hypothetical protein